MAKKKLSDDTSVVELKDQSIREILTENHEAENTPTEPVIETPKEEPIVEPVVEDKADVPVVDTEKIKQELREEVSKDVTESIVKSLSQDRKTEEVPQTPWEKENRTPTWTEALEYVGQQTEKRLEEKQTAKAKEAEDQRTQQLTAEQQNKEQWNGYWNGQLDELSASGKIPKVEKQDQSDEGIKARQALFTEMVKVNTDRMAKGLSTITSIKEIYYEHYTPPSKQPAGADAPVAGKVRSGSANTDTSTYTAADRKKSLGQMLRELSPFS